MGLRTRKIKKVLAEHAEACQAKLNQELGMNFQFEINWNIVPDNVDGWNWQDEDLKTCFYVNFYAPMEAAFGEMLQDEMYKEAIVEQVKTIAFEAGPEGYMKWSFADGVLKCEHTLSVNWKDVERTGSRYIPENAKVITQAVENDLS